MSKKFTAHISGIEDKMGKNIMYVKRMKEKYIKQKLEKGGGLTK